MLWSVCLELLELISVMSLKSFCLVLRTGISKGEMQLNPIIGKLRKYVPVGEGIGQGYGGGRIRQHKEL